jgi:hypothetical protein
MLPERWRRNPPQRRPGATEQPLGEPIALIDDPDLALDAPIEDEPEEEPELSDADFLCQLRADVAGVREGLVPSIAEAMRPALKNRPWSKRHKRRDRRWMRNRLISRGEILHRQCIRVLKIGSRISDNWQH